MKTKFIKNALPFQSERDSQTLVMILYLIAAFYQLLQFCWYGQRVQNEVNSSHQQNHITNGRGSPCAQSAIKSRHSRERNGHKHMTRSEAPITTA